MAVAATSCRSAAAGSLLTKTFKAFSELSGLGWVDGLDDTPLLGLPRMLERGAAGAHPYRKHIRAGDNHVSPVKSGEVIAKSFEAIGDPADGQYALNIVNRSVERSQMLPTVKSLMG